MKTRRNPPALRTVEICDKEGFGYGLVRAYVYPSGPASYPYGPVADIGGVLHPLKGVDDPDAGRIPHVTLSGFFLAPYKANKDKPIVINPKRAKRNPLPFDTAPAEEAANRRRFLSLSAADQDRVRAAMYRKDYAEVERIYAASDRRGTKRNPVASVHEGYDSHGGHGPGGNSPGPTWTVTLHGGGAALVFRNSPWERGSGKARAEAFARSLATTSDVGAALRAQVAASDARREAWVAKHYGARRNPFPAQIGGSENIPEGHAVRHPGVKPLARIRAAISRIDRATSRTETYRAYNQAMKVLHDLQRQGVYVEPALSYGIADSYVDRLATVPTTAEEREQDARDAAYKANMKGKRHRNPTEIERAWGDTGREPTSRMKAENYRKAARALDKMAANSERELSPTHATVLSIRAEAADYRRKADLLDKLRAKGVVKNPARRRKKTGAKRKAFQAQSILLDKDTFTLARAREWLKRNGKKYGKITEGDADWHAEQHPPGDYQPTRKGGYGGFHTIQLGKHVQAVVGIPQRGSDAAEAAGYNTKGPGLFGNRKASGPATVADYNAEDVLY